MPKIFTPDTITDEVLVSDARYDILEDGGGAYKADMQIVLATDVSVAGTDIDKTLLDNIEGGIDELDTKLSLKEDLTSTATAAGATTLDVDSNRIQLFTGSTTQTATMPPVSTLFLGDKFTIINASTGVVTVNSSGGNLIKAIQPDTAFDIYCVLITGTTAASWKYAVAFAPTTAANDFQVGDGSGSWIKKTLAETLVILGLASGVIIPTLTNTTNISASTAIAAYYLKIGSYAFVAGSVSVDPTTTATATVLEISLPVASNFTSTAQCLGLIGDTNGESGIITSEATNDTAKCAWTAVTVTNHTFAYLFGYRIL